MKLNNKPIISARYNLWGGFNSTTTLSEKINSLPNNPKSASGYSLIPVHNWANSVDSILICSELFDEDVRIVTPDKFINLIIENLNHQNNNSFPFLSYPNPTKDIFNIEFREDIKNILSINLHKINGSKQKVKELIVESLGEKLSKIKLDISDIQAGVYLLKINLEHDKVIIDKIIKK